MRNDPLNCGRENDLIGFLYGELNEIEASAFTRHLKECAACNAELEDFGVVRQSVVAWRNESLGSVGLPVQVTNSTSSGAAQARPSAVAALREFFKLSPLWMKGAVAFAAILFVVFAGLALVRLRDKPPSVVVAVPVASPTSPQELNAVVEKRVQEELKRIKNSDQQLASSPEAANGESPKSPAKRRANRNAEVALSNSQKARRPLSKTEREQLAADLRLVSAYDSDLELLDDSINQ
jgi:anti-sigma factor RsiW